jgi:hypothetical protein
MGCDVVVDLTPLDHTNFEPDLIHVKVNPPETDFDPNFVHFEPALGAAP